MFGSRKKQEENSYLEKELVSKQVMLDRYFQVVSEIAVRQKEAENGFDAMSSNQENIEKHLMKVTEAVNGAKEVNARQTERSYALFRQAEKLSEGIGSSEQDYRDVIADVKEQSQEVLELMERSKEFAEPSRFLNQITTELMLEMEGMKKSLEGMEDMGKQMSVLSLNSAIEAGRLGEEGRTFLGTAEEVRTLSGRYQSEAASLSETIERLSARLAETEEQVDKLNQLLRENNVRMGSVTQGYTNSIYQLEHSENQNLTPKMKKLAEYMRKMTENNKVLDKQYEIANKGIESAREEFSRQLNTMGKLRDNSEIIKEQIKVAKLATMEQQ